QKYAPATEFLELFPYNRKGIDYEFSSFLCALDIPRLVVTSVHYTEDQCGWEASEYFYKNVPKPWGIGPKIFRDEKVFRQVLGRHQSKKPKMAFRQGLCDTCMVSKFRDLHAEFKKSNLAYHLLEETQPKVFLIESDDSAGIPPVRAFPDLAYLDLGMHVPIADWFPNIECLSCSPDPYEIDYSGADTSDEVMNEAVPYLDYGWGKFADIYYFYFCI
ncbi:hypothetical protein Bhyg_04468, partial [Pseudolycoriella hygida]